MTHHVSVGASDLDRARRFYDPVLATLGMRRMNADEKSLDHGGADGGAPAVRPEYDAHYYSAFAFDPDVNKVEAVTYSAA